MPTKVTLSARSSRETVRMYARIGGWVVRYDPVDRLWRLPGLRPLPVGPGGWWYIAEAAIKVPVLYGRHPLAELIRYYPNAKVNG
jgi:hypothetical protein